LLGDAGIRGRSWSCRRCGFLLRNGDRRRFAACPDTGGTRRLGASGDLYLDRPLYRRTDWRGAGRSSWSDPFTGGSNTFTSGAGFLGGGQIGANYQWNVLVLGVEGDFNWTGIKENGGDFLGDAIGTETQWTSTVAGRVGAALVRFAVAEFHHGDADDIRVERKLEGSGNQGGHQLPLWWAAIAPIAWRLADRLRLKASGNATGRTIAPH
jgi:hypothetical protein